MASPIVQSSPLTVISGAGATAVTLAGVTAGNAIVVTLAFYDGAASPVVVITDGTTTLAQKVAYSSGGNYSAAVVAWETGVTAGSHTIKVDASPTATTKYPAFQVHEVSGLVASPLDIFVSATTTGATVDPTSGATNTAQASEIVFTVLAVDANAASGTAAETIPSGYTALWAENNGSSYQIGAAAYQVLSAVGPVSAPWTGINLGGGAGAVAIAVSFKTATSSGVSGSAASTDSADTQSAHGTPRIVSSAAKTDSADTQTANGTPR
jgi:hypothetical protein